MLFVLVMEVFNHLISWMDDHGFLTPIVAALPYRVTLYADDVVLFVVPSAGDLQAVMAATQLFGMASGLFSNLDKSVATPIGCTELELNLVRDTLSCKVEQFPCCYLGIPLSIYKLKKLDEQKLIDSVAARMPQWKGRMPNVAGRTALAKATLSAIPVHVAIAIGISSWAVEQIDKRRQAFIWCGDQIVAGEKCKVAWEMVCRPRELGGLGMDLRRAGLALRARWEWKWRIDQGPSGTALPEKKERRLEALFSAATMSTVGLGESTLFWTDNWIDGTSF